LPRCLRRVHLCAAADAFGALSAASSSDGAIVAESDATDDMAAHPERLNGAIALIAGGTIGAGIIALPVKTVAAGFIPSTVALTCSWAYMVITAGLVIELSSYFGAGTNIVTMAEHTLGSTGRVVTVVLYTFIYCATLTAYIAEGAKLMVAMTGAAGVVVPSWLACGAFTAVFSGFVYAGTGPAEKLNSFCLLVAVVAYAALVTFLMGSIDFGNLWRADWGASIAPLPIMVVAFTFHNMIPSLMTYLGSRRLLLTAVIRGSLIPLVFYTLWQGVIMGTVGSAAAALTSADQIVAALRASAGVSAEVAIRIFSFFAIVTSFLGVGLGCVDFLADVIKGFRPKQRSSPKVGVSAAAVADPANKILDRLLPMGVMLTPALLVAVCAPTAFLPALEYSGTLRLILFGMMPAMMVWKIRYGRAAGGGPMNAPPWVAGGKAMLAFVITVAAAIISLELGGKALRALAGA